MFLELEIVLRVELVKKGDVLANGWAYDYSIEAQQDHVKDTVDPIRIEYRPRNTSKSGDKKGKECDNTEFDLIDPIQFLLESVVVFTSDSKLIELVCLLENHEHVQHFFLEVNWHPKDHSWKLA